jgi:hypothetical protein
MLRWKLFQLSIMAAVLCGNIKWQWTPNGYAASLLGVGAAFIATWLLLKLQTLFGGGRPRIGDNLPRRYESPVGARWDTNNLTEGVPSTWVRKKPSQAVEVMTKAPGSIGVLRDSHPLSGARRLGRQSRKS